MYGDRNILTDNSNTVEEVMSVNTPQNLSIKGYYDEELNNVIKGKSPDKKLSTPLAIKYSNGQTALTLSSYKQLAE
jgi:phospholipid-transporting ATPase